MGNKKIQKADLCLSKKSTNCSVQPSWFFPGHFYSFFPTLFKVSTAGHYFTLSPLRSLGEWLLPRTNDAINQDPNQWCYGVVRLSSSYEGPSVFCVFDSKRQGLSGALFQALSALLWGNILQAYLGHELLLLSFCFNFIFPYTIK